MASTIDTMVDRIAHELETACQGVLPPQEARAIADRIVVEYLDGKALEAVAARQAIADIRRLTYRSARAGTCMVPIHKGDLFEILDRWGLR